MNRRMLPPTTMSFDSIVGQDGAIQTLRRALLEDRVHHAYRFEGPNGVGKEMTAMALAQALVCLAPRAGRAHGCGQCRGCQRARTLSQGPLAVPLHPDIVLLERGLYPPEALRRSRPETQDISVDQIRRLVVEKIAYAPHEASARVFIVRRADELSIAAANSLLKILEEPPAGTHFILLTHRGNELLDTIRSRSQVVRFAPLPPTLVRRILQERGVETELAQAAADISGGSVRAALDFADPERSRERQAFVEAVVAAQNSEDMFKGMQLAEGRERDKGRLAELLLALAAHFAEEGRAEVGRNDALSLRAARAHAVVLEAERALDRNMNPALLLEAMLLKLRALPRPLVSPPPRLAPPDPRSP